MGAASIDLSLIRLKNLPVHTLVYLAEDDDSGKSCFGIVGDSGVEKEDAWINLVTILCTKSLNFLRILPWPSACVGTSL